MSNQRAATTNAIDATAALFLDAAKRGGLFLSGDMRVGEKGAAQLLGYAAGHLRALRQEGKGPPCYLRGVGGGRISYRLDDLAEWIESARESS